MDSVAPGKRLIRQGGDTGLSLADRLSERFQRLAWRSPLHAMRLRGRHPLKLITVADDPFIGDAARGNALLDGELMLRGERVAIDALDLAKPGFSRAFAEYLHGFEWLRDLSTVAPRTTAAPIAEAIMRQWLGEHALKVSDLAWRGDLWGRRILHWTAHAPLILSSTDLVYRSSVLHALARGARHLERSAAKEPAGGRRIAATAGLIAAGLMIPGGDARRSFGEAALERAIAQSVHDDGGTVGRSPDELIDVVTTLTMLRETYAARRQEPPAILGETLARLVGALLGLTHGDAGLSCWQGSGPLDGERVADIVAATGVRTRPLRHAREWGYQRLAAGGTVLVIDAAPPPLARAAAAGCASTLAMELSADGQRIVVNCGGGNAALLTMPPELPAALRTTAAHSTLVLGDANSTAINADGTLGRGVTEVELVRQETEGASRIEASHDGYVRRSGLSHRRVATLSADGREVVGEDQLLPDGRRRGSADTGFAVRFHLAPGIEVSPTADGLAALLRLPGGAMWQFRCRGAALSVEESLWINGGGRPRQTLQMVLSGTSPPGGATVGWRFARAGQG